MNGVVYIAYGPKAKKECELSIKSLKQHNPGLPITVIDKSNHPPREAEQRDNFETEVKAAAEAIEKSWQRLVDQSLSGNPGFWNIHR